MGEERTFRHKGVNRLRTLSVLTLAMMLVLVSGQARAATLTRADVTNPAYIDYCGLDYEVRYEGRAGERNDAQFNFVQGEYSPVTTIGPFCWQVTPDISVVSDLAAPISASGGCQNVSRQAAQCGANNLVALSINTYDQRDLVKVGVGNPPAVVSAGTGNDAVNTANGSGYDRISCGDGNDGATGDPGDQIDPDCEKVTRIG
ncbi:MAG: hypothetical protein M3383_04285 [Actinomycetota bacterium]|nr:hypothetical protein [Actinomycetota bacterium]